MPASRNAIVILYFFHIYACSFIHKLYRKRRACTLRHLHFIAHLKYLPLTFFRMGYVKLQNPLPVIPVFSLLSIGIPGIDDRSICNTNYTGNFSNIPDNHPFSGSICLT